MRVKDKKKESPLTKKRQLLSIFHQSVQFLHVFGQEELEWMEDRIHIFVVVKGQLLAREKECVDYLGIIAEGRATARQQYYQIGDVIGRKALLGQETHHECSIVAESDSVVVAIRIIDIMSLDRPSLKNRILLKLVESEASYQLKAQERSFGQFQTLDFQKGQKYLNKEWTDFFGSLDPKQKKLFTSYFPFYLTKHKDIIMNTKSRPSFLYVLHGQLVAKTTEKHAIIDSSKHYNCQGFVFNENAIDNVYCFSNEAVVLIISRDLLTKMFKMDTVRRISNIALQNIIPSHHSRTNQPQLKQPINWSMFKKYDIVPLPQKPTLKEAVKAGSTDNSVNFAAFQTLFREQLGQEGRQKTGGSAESGYERLYSMKTESQGKEAQSLLEVQQLRKEIELLTDKLKAAEEMLRGVKLELIENRSRVGMMAVLKQVRQRFNQEQMIQGVGGKGEKAQPEGLVTLKDALDEQLKTNKINILVAKCAYHWLQVTRQRKATKTS